MLQAMSPILLTTSQMFRDILVLPLFRASVVSVKSTCKHLKRAAAFDVHNTACVPPEGGREGAVGVVLEKSTKPEQKLMLGV